MKKLITLGLIISISAIVFLVSCTDDEPSPQPLEADFSANETAVSVGATINFSNQSTGEINTYAWTFESGTPSSSAEENPSITYNQTGIFSVTLKVSNDTDESTITKSAFITVVDASDFPSLDVQVANLMQQFDMPGVQIAITRNEKLVYQKNYGLAEKSSSTQVTNESLFRIASVSKPITAIAILQLAENNILNLDDPVFGTGAILGTQYGTAPYASNIKDITVRHLLEHTSGWTNDPYDPMFNNLSYSHDELISDMIDNRPLATTPGTTYFYSNFGYCVLGRIIESVSNQTYEQYVQENLLEPIGITEMKIGGNTLSSQFQNEVQYYDQENFSPYNMNVSRMDANGGWIASTTDLARFLIAVDRNSAKPDILNSSSLNELYFSFDNWIFYGSLPGTSAGLSRINDTFGYAFLVNTRTIPVNEILDEMNEMLREEILDKSSWPNHDLFEE